MNILITGASRGVGYALALNLARKGHRVIALARNARALEQLQTESGSSQLFFLPIDLAAADFNRELIPFIRQHFSQLDVLVNNAGLLINKPFPELEDRDFDAIFNLNVKVVFRLVRDLLPLFSGGAHVVNISSMGGVQGSAKFPGLSLYSASKAAVAVLTECLAVELQEKGVKANALALGAVQTEMLAEAFPQYKAPVTAGEMADFIADFALSGHRFFNGKVLPVALSTP